MNIRETVRFLLRSIIKSETPDKIPTPMEILEQANALPWENEAAWQALRKQTYAGEHDAATQEDWERYEDYCDIRDLVEQTWALKIIGDHTAPEPKKLWAENIIKEVKADALHGAFTPPDENEERAVLVKGGKVYKVNNMMLPK